MSQEEMAPEEKRPTAAELKAQIEEKQRELKANPPSVEMPEPAPQDKAETATVASVPDKPIEPAEKAESVTVPSTEDKADEVPGIVKKKGWKDVDSFLKSYSELEKKLGEQGKIQPQAPVYGFPPPPPPMVPSFVPPAFPQQPSPQVISQIARMYPQLAPEDIERVAPLIGDLAETIADRKFRQLEERFVSSERERQRERELERLKQDPHFNNKEVLDEMGSILEANPRITQEMNGLTFAFNQALANVGRKKLEGIAPTPPQPSVPPLPTTPPTTARGTGPSNVSKPGIAAPNRMNPANFSGLPLDEKRRALLAIGALRDGD